MNPSGTSVSEKLLAVLAIAAGGFILLNLTFIGFFLVISGVDLILPGQEASGAGWVLSLGLLVSVVLVGVASYRVLQSDARPLLKAIFLTVPLGVFYAFLGVSLYKWPVIALAVGAAFFAGLLSYLLRSAKPWFYSCALVLVSIAMLAITLTGTDI